MLLSAFSANAAEDVPRLIAAAKRHPYIEEWLDAARTWDKMNRKTRQQVLNELDETLQGVSLFTLVVNDESAKPHGGPKTAKESAADFGFPINARIDRAKRNPGYAEAWLENPSNLPTDQCAAVYVLWLLDTPLKRANLKRCPHDGCDVLFWADAGTRKYKFCEDHRP